MSTSSRPEMLLSLNLLKPSMFYTREQVELHLRTRAPEIDPCMIHDVLTYALDRDILTLAGPMYLRHRVVSMDEAEEFERQSRGRDDGTLDPSRLAGFIRDLPKLEHRVRTLESQVGLLMAEDEGTRWLVINMDQIPRPVYAALRAQAISVLGGAATDDEIHEQMTAVASQLLQEAVRPMMGRS